MGKRDKEFGFRRKNEETFWDMHALAVFGFWILDFGYRRVVLFNANIDCIYSVRMGFLFLG